MQKPIVNIKHENLYVDRDESSKILNEAEKSKDKISALKLYCLISFLANDLFMCGWLRDLDDEMFKLIRKRENIASDQTEMIITDGFVNLSLQTVELLEELIVKSGGIWNSKEQFVFVKVKV